jgi:hypothetical protein
MGLQIPPTFCISQLPQKESDPANFLHKPAPSKRIWRKIMGFQIPPTFWLMLQKESGGKLWVSRSRQLSASAPSKRIQRKIMGFQIPPTFCISQLPQKESIRKLWGSRSRQLSASASSLKKNPAENYGFSDPANFLHQPAPSKRIRRKIMGFQILPTFCISQLSQKESSGKLWVSRSRQLSA